jgi:hypothetical protein
MLGREIGLSFYGHHNVVIPTLGVAPANQTVVKLRSIGLDVPVLEWRLFRMFSLDQSSALKIQFYARFDRPTSSSVVEPAKAEPAHNRDQRSESGVRLAALPSLIHRPGAARRLSTRLPAGE